MLVKVHELEMDTVSLMGLWKVMVVLRKEGGMVRNRWTSRRRRKVLGSIWKEM